MCKTSTVRRGAESFTLTTKRQTPSHCTLLTNQSTPNQAVRMPTAFDTNLKAELRAL